MVAMGLDVWPSVLVLGCAAATKFTGWFLPLPFLVWSCLYRSRPGFTTLLVGRLDRDRRAVRAHAPLVARSGQRRAFGFWNPT